MYQANSQAVTSPSWTTSGSYVTSSTENTYSGPGQAVTATTTYAINGAQQWNPHQQSQVALDYFRPLYGQNIPGRVSQIVSGGGSPAWWPLPSPASWPLPPPARWPSALSAYLPGLQGLPVAGLKGVQGGQTQQIISNAQALQGLGHYSNPIAAGALSSIPNHQQISYFGPSQTASVHSGAQISSEYIALRFSDFFVT